MPEKQNEKDVCSGYMRKKKMTMGFLLFIIGLMWYYNVEWPVILMIVGALVFIKGLIWKTKKK